MSRALLVLVFLILGTLRGEAPVVLEEQNRQGFGEADYKISTAIFEIYLNQNEGIFSEPSVLLPTDDIEITHPVWRLDENQSSFPEPEIVLFDNKRLFAAVHTLRF